MCTTKLILNFFSLISRTNTGKLTEEEELSIVHGSANYSLFMINLVYLASYLLTLMYLLPPYEFSVPVAYAVAAIGSSLVVATLISLKLLQ
jgi:hypothetical protein